MELAQTRRLQYIILLLLGRYSLLIQATPNATCFTPDGKTFADPSDPNDYYSACPTSLDNDGIYMCCKTLGGFEEKCSSQGLCARPNNPSDGEVQGLYRGSCTDPSWSSSSCVHLCTTGVGKQLKLCLKEGLPHRLD